MTTIAERVARGAALLDEQLPGWADHIDLGELALESPCRCILGQLWQGKDPEEPYEMALGELNLDYGEDDAAGFDKMPGTGNWGEYAQLTGAWRELIESRRAAS